MVRLSIFRIITICNKETFANNPKFVMKNSTNITHCLKVFAINKPIKRILDKSCVYCGFNHLFWFLTKILNIKGN